MGLVRKIKAGLVKVSVNDFVGEDGNIFFDIDDGVLRLSDGITPGGVPLSSGGEGGATTFKELLDTPGSFTGAGGYFVKVNPQASALEFVDVDLFDGDYNSLSNLPTLFNPSSITTSLLPQTDVAIDLGSAAKKWRDLYLSGTTIYLGDATISRNDSGAISLPAGSTVGGTVIGTGGVTSYNDLTDTPDLSVYQLSANAFSGSYNDLTDKPVLFSGAYADLTGAPDLSVYQLSANAFSGSYNDLTDKPTIPTVPTNISAFTNDSGYITGYTVTEADVTQHQSALSITESQISDLGTYLTSVAFDDLTTTPTTLAGYGITDAFDGAYSSLTGAPDLSVYQLSANAFSGSYNDLTDKPTFDGSYSSLTGTPDLSVYQLSANAFSGDYNDLINTPTIPTVPTTISSFTNDSGYITDYTVTEADVTQHQAALSITESQISDLGAYLTSETTTSLSINSNILSYTDETGAVTQIDLSLYLDDTNLAYINSGSIDPATGIATFTRDDATSFTVDMSAFLDDTNLARIDSAAFNTTDGVLTFTRGADGSTVTVDLDGRFALTSDIPTVPTTVSSFTNDAGYITDYTVTQADVTQHQAALSITESQISDLQNYLTSVAFADLTTTPTTLAGYGITDAFDGAYSSLTGAPDLSVYQLAANAFSGLYADLTGAPTTVSSFTNDAGYITDYTVTEADVTQHQAALSITESQISDLQNYLTSETTTSLSINSNILSYTDEAGVTTQIDLSLYLDDTNLAYIVSGSVDAVTGIATFTRDDATSFTVDMSAFFDDTNLSRIDSASFNTEDGVLTLTRGLDASTVTVDLDGRFALPSDIPTNVSQLSNDSGYITGYTVTQADVTQHQAALSITESQISDFGTYEPADATILKSAAIGVTVQAYDANIVSDATYAHITVTSTSVTDGTTTFNQYDDTAIAGRVTTLENAGYITGYTVTQADVTQHQAALSITESQISDLQSYLTSVAFADLTTTPTTLAGYGITDAATATQGTKADTALQPNTAFDVKGSVFADDSTLLVDAVRGVIPFTVLDGKPTTLSGYGITDAYTATQVDNAITVAVNQILGDAPALLDTLGEIADAVGDDANFITTINNAISLKANSADLAVVATTGSYNDLADTPTVPTDVNQLTDADNLLAASGSNITEDDLITYSILFG